MATSPSLVGSNTLTELGEHRTWRFFLQICLALEVIHEKGIVHADLKPSNLLTTGRDYDLKLTDFGVSKLWNRALTFLSLFGCRSVKRCRLGTTSHMISTARCPTVAPKFSKGSHITKRQTSGH